MRRCPLAPCREQRDLVTPLRQAEEQRPEHRADQQPVTDVHANHQSSRHRPQHEADGDRHHIEDDDVLQRAGIDDEQREVRRRRHAERRPQRERRGQRDRAQHHGRDQGGARRQISGRDRPHPLDRMLPILLAVRDVVDQIHGAGQRAKNQKGRRGFRRGGRIEQFDGKNQCGKNDEVLGPLIRSQRNEQARRR